MSRITSRLTKGVMSSASDRWFTPPDLLRDITDFLGGSYYDPCPASVSGQPIESGLWASWTSPTFCNPPYGRAIGAWIRKAMTEQVDELVLLVPARTDTAWFQPLWTCAICFVRGRLHFSGAQGGAPFPSALVYRGQSPEAFAEAFSRWGTTVRAVNVRLDEGECVMCHCDAWTPGRISADCECACHVWPRGETGAGA